MHSLDDHTMKFWDVDSGECSSTVGPDVTAKLCLAPNQTLTGVAVSGGENKTNTGNDFRVNLLSKQHGGRDRLTTYAADHAIKFDLGGLEKDKDGTASKGSKSKKNRKKAKGKSKKVPDETEQSATGVEQADHGKESGPEGEAAEQAVVASPSGHSVVESNSKSGGAGDLEFIGQGLSNMSASKGQGDLHAKRTPCLSDTPVAAFDKEHAAEAPSVSDRSGASEAAVAAEAVAGGRAAAPTADSWRRPGGTFPYYSKKGWREPRTRTPRQRSAFLRRALLGPKKTWGGAEKKKAAPACGVRFLRGR